MKTGSIALLTAVLSIALFSSNAPAAQLTISLESPQGFYDPDDPGGGEHGPYDWLQLGVRFSGFWFTNVGTPGGSSQRGHTHLTVNGYGGNLSEYMHSYQDALQGIRLTRENGGPFEVVSIDYRVVTRDVAPNNEPWTTIYERHPWSVPVSDTHLLLANQIDPVAANFIMFEQQFARYSIDDGSMLDLGGGQFDPLRPDGSLTLQTLEIDGFEAVTEVFISHSGNLVYIDNIVINTLPLLEQQDVPAPGLLLAPALAIAGAIGAWRSTKRA